MPATLVMMNTARNDGQGLKTTHGWCIMKETNFGCGGVDPALRPTPNATKLGFFVAFNAYSVSIGDGTREEPVHDA